MKKLMYLLVAGTMFAFTACNCGTGDATATDVVEDSCQRIQRACASLKY